MRKNAARILRARFVPRYLVPNILFSLLLLLKRDIGVPRDGTGEPGIAENVKVEGEVKRSEERLANHSLGESKISCADRYPSVFVRLRGVLKEHSLSSLRHKECSWQWIFYCAPNSQLD